MTGRGPAPRRRARIAIAACVAAALAGGGASASTDPASNPHAVPGEYDSPVPSSSTTSSAGESYSGRALVRFRTGTDDALRRVAHARAGASVVRRIPGIGYDEVAFSGGTPLDAVLASYRADPSVAVAEPVLRGRIALAPPDSCLATPCEGLAGQWHLALTNAPFGWDAFPGRTVTAADKRAAPGVTIAVLDTKIDASHPDFVNAGGASTDSAAGGQLDLAGARDWIPPSRRSGAAAYHGTFVAGLAAAAAGNGGDAAGIGYAARVLPLTVVDGGGNTDAAALADAIVYAWRRGARVINLSLGILGDSQAVHDAIRLVARDSLVVAAAGNNTGSAPFYPGSYPEALSVAGTDANDRPAPCSNYNPNVSVSAPADRLVGLSPMPARVMRAPCGTSAAAPQVSGLAALLFMQDPSRTPAQVRALIERGADDLGSAGRDDRFGTGRIDAERSLRLGAAQTTLARATVVSQSASTVTALASSATGIVSAQMVFDRPDAPPVAMSAADGWFGGTVERLTATLRVPAGTAPGPHPVWVRAFDGSAWGPATVGVVAVDARAPLISGAAATNAVRATGEAITVTFTAIDDYADTLTYGIEFRSSASGAIVARLARASVPAGAQRASWSPGLGMPAGPYRIKIAVADRSGNVSQLEVGAIVA